MHFISGKRFNFNSRSLSPDANSKLLQKREMKNDKMFFKFFSKLQLRGPLEDDCSCYISNGTFVVFFVLKFEFSEVKYACSRIYEYFAYMS